MCSKDAQTLGAEGVLASWGGSDASGGVVEGRLGGQGVPGHVERHGAAQMQVGKGEHPTSNISMVYGYGG